MGRRQNLNALAASERQALVNLIIQHLNDTIVAAHTTITHSGEHIFTGHRLYIEELEVFLTAQGGGRFVPLPAWNPANPIPPEFNVVKPQNNGTARPALVNLNPNLPMPSQWAAPAVCNFASAEALGNDINGWHGSVHGAIGGTMGSLAIASAAPIFWCWHAFVDEIYWDYQQCAARTDVEIILFEHINFRGRHKHVYTAEPNLNAGDDSFFNDRVSSMVVLGGNCEVFRHSQYNQPYPVVLGPGLHSWVGAIGITNDDMSSLRPTSRAATVQGQPIHANAILFEHVNFRGAHKHVFNEEGNLATADDWFFNDRTSSIAVLSETWQFFQHINFVSPYPRTLGVGLHPWVVDAQIQNDALSSLRHLHGQPPQQPGTPITAHLVLFEHANFHGAHKHLFRGEPNFNAGGDSFFNDRVSSLAVRQGRWRCFRHAGFVSPYPPALAQGLYPWVRAIGITNDDMSSARPE